MSTLTPSIPSGHAVTVARTSSIPTDARIARGRHETRSGGANVLEWLWLAGKHPKRIPPVAGLLEGSNDFEVAPEKVRACPWTAAFVHVFAEGIEDQDRRDALIRPLLLDLPGTATEGRVASLRRSLVAYRWVVKTALPRVLAPIDQIAVALRGDRAASNRATQAIDALGPLEGEWVRDAEYDGALEGAVLAMRDWYVASRMAYDLMVTRRDELFTDAIQEVKLSSSRELAAAAGIEAAVRASRGLTVASLAGPMHFAIGAIADALSIGHTWSRVYGGDIDLTECIEELQISAALCARDMLAIA